MQLISLETDAEGTSSLRTIFTIPSRMKPTQLHGDLLAISDDVSQTVIWNWRAAASAVLQHQDDRESGVWQVRILHPALSTPPRLTK